MSGHYADYWGNKAVEHQVSDQSTPTEQAEDVLTDKVLAQTALEDYWGSSTRPPMQIEPMPDMVPWTIANAEEIGEESGAVNDTGAVPYPKVDTSGLAIPPHIPPGAAELGYGRYGAPAPFIPSREQELEQRIVIAVAEKIVAEQRPLLVQQKAADNAHFETYPFTNGEIIGGPPVRIGTRHPNGIGYLLMASAAGLYIGSDQTVGLGNQGIPIPGVGAQFLTIPANCDLWISSAGAALSQAISLYVVQLFMGSTTL